MGLFSSFSPAARKLKTYQAMVPLILQLQPALAELDEDGLRSYGAELRKRAAAGDAETALLPEAFALVKETSRRLIGLEHFPEQLLGAIALYFGNIAEMKTGEGKTLVATCPLYLNALMGHKGHLVTVNDYLAKRDRAWMGPIYEFLGMSVGLLQNDSSPEERGAAYAADITYGTNNEFGFDYLRDHMAGSEDGMFQKGVLDFAIVDEVDNIFIDEARTALIIAGPGGDSDMPYYEAAAFVKRLKGTVRSEMPAGDNETPAGSDYVYDEKHKTIDPAEDLLARFARAARIPEDKLLKEQATYGKILRNAIRAQVFFRKDSEYIIKDTEVVIVDEFTGRLMYGRRYSEGLHQAIEAKEGLKVREESQTLATITIQNFFKMYDKLSGMTGTALTEADEFKEIYGLDVLEIPTHRPVGRQDADDEVYRSERGKLDAILREIQARHEKGQPVLVGTRSVKKSEALSQELRKLGIKPQVLNATIQEFSAKPHEKEAEIIAQAGRKGSVTIATNMAGRGVDILLGGNPVALAHAAAIAHTKADPKKQPEQYAEQYAKLLTEYRESCSKEHDDVVSLGGLFILGTERHESRRIDNQLRGRSGRQGDPGESKFFLSAEDDILRIFGGDRIQRIFEMMKVEESMPVNHPLLSKTIEMSQKKVESYNFDARKSLLDYDNVLNKQREVIYAERDKVLAGVDLADEVHEFINEQAETTAQQVVQAQRADETDLGKVYNDLVLDAFGRPVEMTLEELTDLVERRDSEQQLTAMIQDRAEAIYREKYNRYGENVMHQIEHYFFLHTIDSAWRDHLLQMDDLKDGIGLRAYGQQDPVIAYQKEGYDLFNQLMDQIKHDVTRALFTFELQPAQPEKKHDRS
ncbi:preprotein translocase subunit SecA [Candidatus Cryosericum septentrionale]|jgi:preprotein translocase subunit SecA|uniref:Protein translocase subunit SecA n=1 Tax=Candidatus Cryosericum septentrionale TaxID=2290913 RepID=A0A398DP71_9BACT|nr:preprotein translocase subunit SecA [Candidatus Cryosericum septentrionale]RIE16770.1 preprotein translocase subunit SecA [Candidatus Cryosericum septentrionale]